MRTQDRLTEVLENLKNQGLRLTPQRLAVLRILVSDKTHPTVDSVYAAVKKEFPMTSLATVYKTIAVLKDLDEVKELHFDNQGSRYDGVTRSLHPHLICTECRKIIDTDLAAWEQVAKVLHSETGFQINSYRMDIFGICPDCQAKLLSA
jgi:Fur family peroxide stress response transcriptional regulator